MARTRQETWEEAIAETHRHGGRYGLLLAMALVVALVSAERLVSDAVGGQIDMSALVTSLVLLPTLWISAVLGAQFRRRSQPPWYWLALGA